jgi:hypothetical protein
MAGESNPDVRSADVPPTFRVRGARCCGPDLGVSIPEEVRDRPEAGLRTQTIRRGAVGLSGSGRTLGRYWYSVTHCCSAAKVATSAMNSGRTV